MYFAQGDLFHGMGKEFVKEIMDIAVKESYEKAGVLFHKGDAASHFYILLKGDVRLTTGEAGHVIHVVSHAGEAFGWSSLAERDVYSASAECSKPTTLLKINGNTLQEILAKDPANGVVFYKRLAGTLGRRLIQSYGMIGSASQAESSSSFGAGHLMDTHPS